MPASEVPPSLCRWSSSPARSSAESQYVKGSGLDTVRPWPRWGRVTAQLRPEGWLEVRAGPEPDIVVADATAFATLDRLQNWTRAGKYLLTEAGSLRIAVLTPLLGQVSGQDPADPIGWSIDQAMVMCQVARRHLSGQARKSS